MLSQQMSEDNKNPGAESPNNLCIIFGPRPQKAINNDSKTIRHFIELIAKCQDDQRSVSFPDLINVDASEEYKLSFKLLDLFLVISDLLVQLNVLFAEETVLHSHLMHPFNPLLFYPPNL